MEKQSIKELAAKEYGRRHEVHERRVHQQADEVAVIILSQEPTATQSNLRGNIFVPQDPPKGLAHGELRAD
jgi:hypothetical protein